MARISRAGAPGVAPRISSLTVQFHQRGAAIQPPDDLPNEDGAEGGCNSGDTYPIARALLAWHLSDDCQNTVTSIGAGDFRVNTIYDLSGNGNHLTDTGPAEGPIYPDRPNGSNIALQNGRQPVYFGGNGGISVWPTDLFDGVTEAELWIVVRAAGGDPNGNFSGISWADKCWQLGPGTAVARWARHDSGTADTGGISEDFGSSVTRDLGDAPGSLASWRIYNVRAAAGHYRAALDGSVFYSDDTNTVAFSSAPTMGNAGCMLDIGEIAIHSAILTTVERATVLAKLQERWGL